MKKTKEQKIIEEMQELATELGNRSGNLVYSLPYAQAYDILIIKRLDKILKELKK